MSKLKLIFDISKEMNSGLERLAERRGSNKACLARWAISKMLEVEGVTNASS